MNVILFVLNIEFQFLYFVLSYLLLPLPLPFFSLRPSFLSPFPFLFVGHADDADTIGFIGVVQVGSEHIVALV